MWWARGSGRRWTRRRGWPLRELEEMGWPILLSEERREDSVGRLPMCRYEMTEGEGGGSCLPEGEWESRVAEEGRGRR